MFKYFSEEKQLDNLVWVWGGGGTHSLEMYPGPEYVDMVGFSHYGSETTRSHNEYEHMLKYNKPVSFTEFGPAGNEEPAYDNLNLIRAVREQYPQMISATYWHSWTGVRTAIADCRNVEALMNHPWVIDRDELDWREVKVDAVD
jgi:beta-mannanase